MRQFVTLALGLVAVLMLVGQFLSPVHPLDQTAAAPGEVLAATGSSPRQGAFTAEGLVLDRDASGQFHLDAAVNGTTTRFLVDTGADSVALTVADAERAGIKVDPASFQPILQTASGQGWGTLVELERIEVGRTEIRNVGAVVVKDLGVSLLGQSVLARMGKVELKGDRMVLEPAN